MVKSLPKPKTKNSLTTETTMNKSIFYRFAVTLAFGLLAAMPVYAGGGGWLIKPLGLMLGGAMVITIILTWLKQANILSFIIMGIVMGLALGLQTSGLADHESHYPGMASILSGFQEIGIILVMFMAGVNFNLKDITKRLGFIISNGVGFIGLGLLFFYWAATRFAGTEGFSESIFFALCLVVPSSFLVSASLQYREDEDSLHGQIATGTTVIGTLLAVVLLAKLQATGSLDSGASSAVSNLWLTEQILLLVVIVMLISKFILEPVVRYLLRSSELLFISAVGYCMGIAAICGALGISPEAGAFFAGISLGSLPYRLDIEDKVGPLKSFGAILLFLTLGVNMSDLDGSLYSNNVGVIITLTLLVVIIKPIIVIITGSLTNIKSRTAFLGGVTTNQASEITIIIALLAWKAGVFSDEIFAILISVSLLSFVVSALGQWAQFSLFNGFKGMLHFMDRNPSAFEITRDHGMEMKDHVVLLAYNEVSYEVAEYYQQKGEKVLMIDTDPEIIRHFQAQKESNIVPLYADIMDSSIWSEFKFDQAKLVVSCRGLLQMNIELSDFLRQKSPDLPFVAVTTSHEDALELYDNNVRYVVQTDYMASKSFRDVFAKEIDKPGAESFGDSGSQHWKDTRAIRDNLGEIFKLV